VPANICGPLPDVPGVLVTKVVSTCATHDAQMKNFWSYTGTPAPSDMVTLANQALASLNSLYSGAGTGGSTYISNEWATAYATATDLASPTAAFGQSSGATEIGQASQKGINSSALVLSHHVNRRFRGGHSRTYLGGLTADNTNDGRTWIAIAVSDILNWWTGTFVNDIKTNWSSFTITGLVQVSYYDKATEPAPCYRRTTPIVDAVQDTTASNIIRSQRRRVRNTPTPS